MSELPPGRTEGPIVLAPLEPAEIPRLFQRYFRCPVGHRFPSMVKSGEDTVLCPHCPVNTGVAGDAEPASGQVCRVDEDQVTPVGLTPLVGGREMDVRTCLRGEEE
jgi:hypothetical protein